MATLNQWIGAFAWICGFVGGIIIFFIPRPPPPEPVCLPCEGALLAFGVVLAVSSAVAFAVNVMRMARNRASPAPGEG